MKNKSLHTKILTVLGFLFALSIPSNAQWKDNMGGNWNNPTSASLGNIINDRLWNRMRAKARARKSRASAPANSNIAKTPASQPGIPKVTANDSSLKFRTTGASLKARGLADQLGETAEERQQYLALMQGVLKGYDDEAKKLGRTNDISLALAFFLLTNSTVYNERAEPTDAQFLEMSDAITEILLEADTLNGVSDRQKQEMSETLVLFTGLAGWGYQTSMQSGDAAAAKSYKQLAGQNLQTVLGISPDKITFGVDGLAINAGSENEDRIIRPANSNTSSSGRTSTAPVISYTELAREYLDNEIAAQTKYDGKRIVVSGRVHSVKNVGGKIELHFIDPFSISIPVNCYFAMSHASAVGKLKHKDEIVVEGTVHGSNYGGIVLENCVLK